MKSPSSCKGDSEWSLVQPAAAPNLEEPIESMLIKNTIHHQLLSHLWLLHPQFQHLVMRDTSLWRRRMWRRGGDGNWGRGRWCICQWLKGGYLAWWWGNKHEHCTLDFIDTFSLHYWTVYIVFVQYLWWDNKYSVQTKFLIAKFC